MYLNNLEVKPTIVLIIFLFPFFLFVNYGIYIVWAQAAIGSPSPGARLSDERYAGLYNWRIRAYPTT